ncbi:hypothetical protein [Bradyrhizobium sp. CCBAU 51765]|uniref:hypothetical protein n=1 Tax=Bradyrhizobium sp. CCBAU 51765 TaxID=1325102 RepID=UPI0018891BE6|nr:hypothetical protein [Bradyrhizobium sp. CCBAU 51765]QOZ06850.1 hypothetical protein XH96_04430 [Bradyrhizobium sp. CCBAU 51765]
MDRLTAQGNGTRNAASRQLPFDRKSGGSALIRIKFAADPPLTDGEDGHELTGSLAALRTIFRTADKLAEVLAGAAAGAWRRMTA